MQGMIKFLIVGVFAVMGAVAHAAPVGGITETGGAATPSVHGMSSCYEPALTEIFGDDSVLQFGG